VKHISENVSIPVIASSGAGKVEYFSEVFEKTDAEAALAAGVFHREELPIEAVKQHMKGARYRDAITIVKILCPLISHYIAQCLYFFVPFLILASFAFFLLARRANKKVSNLIRMTYDTIALNVPAMILPQISGTMMSMPNFATAES